MRSKRKNKVSKQRLRQSKVRKTSLRKNKRTQRRKSKKSSQKTRRSFIKKSRKKRSKLKGGAQESVDEVLEKLVGTWEVEFTAFGEHIEGKKNGEKINSVGAGLSVHMGQPYQPDEQSTEQFTIEKYHPPWMISPMYRGKGISGESIFTLTDIQVKDTEDIVMTQYYLDDMSTRWKFTISADEKNLKGNLSAINLDGTEQKFGIFTAQKIETATLHASQLSQSTESPPSEIPTIMLTVRNTTMGGGVAFKGILPINTSIRELKEKIEKSRRPHPPGQEISFNLYKTKETWVPAIYGWKLKRTGKLDDENKTLGEYGILTDSTIEIEIVRSPSLNLDFMVENQDR